MKTSKLSVLGYGLAIAAGVGSAFYSAWTPNSAAVVLFSVVVLSTVAVSLFPICFRMLKDVKAARNVTRPQVRVVDTRSVSQFIAIDALKGDPTLNGAIFYPPLGSPDHFELAFGARDFELILVAIGRENLYEPNIRVLEEGFASVAVSLNKISVEALIRKLT